MDNLHRELLKIEDLTVDFSTRQGIIHAVRNVNFQLNTREILGIVGESGSGKSVSMLSVMNLLAENAVVKSGSIRFEGNELSTAHLSTKQEKKRTRKDDDGDPWKRDRYGVSGSNDLSESGIEDRGTDDGRYSET